MSAHDNAICKQVIWKNTELQSFAVAVVRRAIELYRQGVYVFASDDVPLAPLGNGTSGSVMQVLRVANVIKHFRGNIEPDTWGGFRPSKRKASNRALIATYVLTSMTVAETFLRRNGAIVEPEQLEMFG